MKPVTVDMLRAHLMAAALTAMIMEAVTLASFFLFDFAEGAFRSMTFRLLGVAVIICGLAYLAFGVAVKSRHATCRNQQSALISVSPDCPRRQLVILHLRLTGKPFELAQC